MSILVVHDTPIKTGIHKEILETTLRAHKQEFEVVNVFSGLSDKDLKKMKATDWLQHSDRIHEAAKKHDKILCCGALSAATTFASTQAHAITRIRGRGFVAPSGHYTICTYSPGTCVKDANFFRDFDFDVQKLSLHSAPMAQPDLEIVFIERKKDLVLLRDLHDASFIGADTETTSLNPYHAQILGIGFCALQPSGKGYAVVVPDRLIGDEVLRFLKTYEGTMVWHNLLYDFQPIWKKWGEFIPKATLADTMLMHWALDERPFNRYRSHGLDLLQRLHFDTPPKSVNMKDWLEEYFREDVGKKARMEWAEMFCEEHGEMARTAWREWHIEQFGEEADWRGKKVLRDIAVSTVLPALMQKRMPKQMLPAPDKIRKAQMWDDMMRYMAEDCFSTARLYPLFREQMDEESELLWKAHQTFDIPASLAFASMRLTGAPVDVDYLFNMKVDIEGQLVTDMKDMRSLVTEYTAHPKGPEFNPNSSLQVKEVLYDKGKGLGLKMPVGVGRYAYKRDVAEVTTNSDTLKVLARNVAPKRPGIANLINQILKYRVKSKILGTYVDGILTRVDPDGCIRGDFNLHGTATARVSASNPNLQNIPDASHVGFDVRRAYIPPEGWVLLDADMSQLELRIAALFSQDAVMLDAYRNGADIHQEVAFLLWNKPKEEITKYERYLAKCMNFGVIYGRGARSISTGPEMDNLVEMSGRSWNNAEIDAYFAKFKEGYGDLFSWMGLVKKDSMNKRYVQSPTGHMRRFDLILQSERGHIERQTVNTPIQGFAARVTVNALVQLWKKFDPEYQRILFTVHDSIMAACHPDAVQETATLMKHTMENALPLVQMTLPVLPHAPFRPGDRLDYNLPFVADVHIGPNWGDCENDADHYIVQDPDEEVFA